MNGVVHMQHHQHIPTLLYYEQSLLFPELDLCLLIHWKHEKMSQVLFCLKSTYPNLRAMVFRYDY